MKKTIYILIVFVLIFTQVGIGQARQGDLPAEGAPSAAAVVAETALSAEQPAQESPGLLLDFSQDGQASILAASKTVLVSAVPAGLPLVQVVDPSLSQDGRFVVFSTNKALVAIDTPGPYNAYEDVYVYDRDADGDGIFDETGATNTILVSVNSAGQIGSLGAKHPSISADGRYVVYESSSPELDTSVPLHPNGAPSIYLHDRDADQDNIFDEPGAISTRCIVLNAAGKIPDHGAVAPVISGNGRHVVFGSRSTDLVAVDINHQNNKFVIDLQTGGIDLITADSSGNPSQGAVMNTDAPVSISDDGRYVVFYSNVSDLVANDANNAEDVFLRDRDTDQDQIFDEPGAVSTTIISTTADGTLGDSSSSEGVISGNGRYVAFASYADNLVQGAPTDKFGIFVKDLLTGSVSYVLRASDGTPGDNGGRSARISRDGRYVVYGSTSGNLVPYDPYTCTSYSTTFNCSDVFRHDRDADGDMIFDEPGAISTSLVSLAPDGALSPAGFTRPALSADGQSVVFITGSTAYGRDLASNTGFWVSSDPQSGGQGAYGSSKAGQISADNNTVVFASSANNLVPGDLNMKDDVFALDRASMVISRVSVSSQGMQGNGPSGHPSVSADGRYVAFESKASNLVISDTVMCSGYSGMWNCTDIFVHDRLTGSTVMVSVAPDGSPGNYYSNAPDISADGRYVAFSSTANNLVAGDTGPTDIFVHDRDVDGDGVFDEPGAIANILVSISSAGVQAASGADGFQLDLSPDGRFVVFSSSSANLVPGDTNGQKDVFVHDRDADEDGIFDEPGGIETSRVSVSSEGIQGDRSAGDYFTFISADGRYVIFESNATTLVAGDTNSTTDVFLHDRNTGETRRISVGPEGIESNGASNAGCGLDRVGQAMSDNGRYIIFSSGATNLVANDANANVQDIFVYDQNSGANSLVSLSPEETQFTTESRCGSISANGRYAMFTNSVDDGYGIAQLYLRTLDVSPYWWSQPSGRILHGTETLAWNGEGAAGMITATLSAYQAGVEYPIASGLPPAGSYDWDSSQLADGQYQLRLDFFNQDGSQAGQAARSVIVLNHSVAWHAGVIQSNEVWGIGVVHIVEENVTITNAVTVQVTAGAVVKFERSRSITVADGGRLEASGAAGQPAIFTSLFDDTAGGDTDFDSGLVKPRPGDWNGIGVLGSGVFVRNEPVELRYLVARHTGTLTRNEAWDGALVHIIEGELIVPDGIALTINPGAVIKFNQGASLWIDPLASLTVNGSLAQPVVFTSWRDDAYGGDSNQDFSQSIPKPGDWLYVYIEGQANINHAIFRYGGANAAVNEQGAIIYHTGSQGLHLDNSIVSDSYYDGLVISGPTQATNSLFYNNDRGVSARGGALLSLVNCTIDNNVIGMQLHGGDISAVNTIVSRSASAGAIWDYATSALTIRYSNLWNPSATDGNYVGLPDQTGQNGNLSVNPEYRAPEQGDYHLAYISPMIDAGDGPAAPATDLGGAPRYDDPRVANSGLPRADQSYADLGAYEFVEAAGSNIDLVVSEISGPLQVLAGDKVSVQWTVTNLGEEAAQGPWHDRISLIYAPDASPIEAIAAEVLVGQGLTLGSGQSVTFQAEVTAPGAVLGENRWHVIVNSRQEVFEGQNFANNAALSPAPVTVDYPELPIGTTGVSGQFTQAGQWLWYKLTPGADNLLVSLQLAGQGALGLYARYQLPASKESYDFIAGGNAQANQKMQLNGGMWGVYYLALHAETLGQTPAAFTLAAQPVNFSLETISPSSVGQGAVTLKINGANLDAYSQAVLIPPAGGVISPTVNFWWTPNELFATFDLSLAQPGAYDVRVTDSTGASITLPDSLQVSSGGAPQLWTDLVLPDAIRLGRPFTFYLYYGNRGNVDALASLMTIQTVEAITWTLEGSMIPLPLSYDFLAISHEGPAGSLRPGETYRTAFQATLLEYDIPEFYYWQQVAEQQISPETMITRVGGDPAVAPWDAALLDLQARFGPGFAQYKAGLADYATELSLVGYFEGSLERLLALATTEAYLTHAEIPPSVNKLGSLTLTADDICTPQVYDTGKNTWGPGSRLPAPDNRWTPWPTPRLPTPLELQDADFDVRVKKTYFGWWFFNREEWYQWFNIWRSGSNTPWVAGYGSRLSNDAIKFLSYSKEQGDQFQRKVWDFLEFELSTLNPPEGESEYMYIPTADRRVVDVDLSDTVYPLPGRVRWALGGGKMVVGKDADGNLINIKVYLNRNNSSDSDNSFDYVDWRVIYVPFRFEDTFAVDEHVVNPEARIQGQKVWKGDPAYAYQSYYLLETFDTAHCFNWYLNMMVYEKTGRVTLAGVKANAGPDETWYIQRGQNRAHGKLKGKARTYLVNLSPTGAYTWFGDPIDPPDEAQPVLALPEGKFDFTLKVTGASKPPTPKKYSDSDKVKITVIDLNDDDVQKKSTKVAQAYDPNEKAGPSGFGDAGYLTTLAPMPFTIYFENDPAHATAPAQEVLITDTLDADLDWSSFEWMELAFGDHRVQVPAGMQNYETILDLRPEGQELLVKLECSLNPATGLITARFTSLHPQTLQLPEDPFAGFLPPNNAQHVGEGHISYQVKPKSNLPDGTQIRNRAAITFDVTYGANPPIITNETLNTLDRTAPISQLNALPATSASGFMVRWSGSDSGGSGVAAYTVYVAVDGGAFSPWITTPDTSALFRGQGGHTYGFYVVAQDSAGNREIRAAAAQASTHAMDTLFLPLVARK